MDRPTCPDTAVAQCGNCDYTKAEKVSVVDLYRHRPATKVPYAINSKTLWTTMQVPCMPVNSGEFKMLES